VGAEWEFMLVSGPSPPFIAGGGLETQGLFFCQELVGGESLVVDAEADRGVAFSYEEACAELGCYVVGLVADTCGGCYGDSGVRWGLLLLEVVQLGEVEYDLHGGLSGGSGHGPRTHDDARCDVVVAGVDGYTDDGADFGWSEDGAGVGDWDCGWSRGGRWRRWGMAAEEQECSCKKGEGRFRVHGRWPPGRLPKEACSWLAAPR